MSECNNSIAKIVRASHHQGDSRYGISSGMQCSCMSLMSICWTMFKKLVARWDMFELDSILENGDKLFKDIQLFRYLGIDDLPHHFVLKQSQINVQYLENMTGEICHNAYLTSISEIISNCQSIGSGALLIINNYTLAILWGRQCFFIFDSHSRDEEGKKSANGTAVLLKFHSLAKLEEYIKSTYYGETQQASMYFQIQFVKFLCAEDDTKAIISEMKRLRKVQQQREQYSKNPIPRLNRLKRKYTENPGPS